VRQSIGSSFAGAICEFDIHIEGVDAAQPSVWPASSAYRLSAGHEIKRPQPCPEIYTPREHDNMPKPEDSQSGSLKGIIVAIVIGIAVSGSAPWWWSEVFPSHEIRPTVPQAPIQEAPRGVGACASGASPDGNFHNSPAANGSWDWNCDGQIERAFGSCESLSRQQCDPNTNVTNVPPGFCSELRAPAGCVPQVAECGHAGYIYPCFYNSADGRCHAGGYETPTTMQCR